MKFENRDTVRVVSAANMFFGCTGTVVACHDGDFVTGDAHYRVMLRIAGSIEVDNSSTTAAAVFVVPVLLREFDLAHSL